MKQILQKYNSGRMHECTSESRSTDSEPFRLTQRHFSFPYLKNAAIRKNIRHKCVVCRKHNGRSATHYKCMKYDIGLYIYPCYKLCHTLLDH